MSERTYKLKVDRKEHKTKFPLLGGCQILRLAKKTPESRALYLKVLGSQPKRIQPQDMISMQGATMPLFVTLPLGQTDG